MANPETLSTLRIRLNGVVVMEKPAEELEGVLRAAKLLRQLNPKEKVSIHRVTWERKSERPINATRSKTVPVSVN